MTTAAPSWDPGQYLRYADDRARPFADLLARVPTRRPAIVVDLGCGPGTLTTRLAERWPEAIVVGVDSSPDMIAAAHGRSTGRLRFEQGDVRTWEPDAPVDVIVANALLHWVPDRLDLIARFADWLAPDGAVAVQVPGNGAAPSHRVAAEVCASARWRDQLSGALVDTDTDPGDYLEALLRAGLRADVWETTYLHVLRGDDPVLEWLEGTTLRPVLARLDPHERSEFRAELAERLRAAYPVTAHGVVFPFRRVFAVGHRPATR
jgi:trans-aconitate 2-methyltransferase